LMLNTPNVFGTDFGQFKINIKRIMNS
jgi:hypothetical protein